MLDNATHPKCMTYAHGGPCGQWLLSHMWVCGAGRLPSSAQGTHQSRMYAGIFHAGRSASAGAAAAEATIVLVRRCCCCRVQKGGSAVAETRPCGSEMVHGTETGRRRL